MIARRTIHRAGPVARRELLDLMTVLWAAEVIRPSRVLFLAAPVVADTLLLDNRAGSFSGLEPAWGERTIGLAELIVRNLIFGGQVRVITRKTMGSGSNPFLVRIRELAAELNLAGRLGTSEIDSPTPLGVVGDDFALIGGLSFAESAIDFAEEAVALNVGSDADAWSAKFRASYGGLGG